MVRRAFGFCGASCLCADRSPEKLLDRDKERRPAVAKDVKGAKIPSELKVKRVGVDALPLVLANRLSNTDIA